MVVVLAHTAFLFAGFLLCLITTPVLARATQPVLAAKASSPSKEAKTYYIDAEASNAVILELQIGANIHVGLGRCERGELQTVGADVLESWLRIDLRTLRFSGNNSLWIKSGLLDPYEDPWLSISTSTNTNAGKATVQWRGKTHAYTVQQVLGRTPVNAYGPRRPATETHSLDLSLSINLNDYGYHAPEWKNAGFDPPLVKLRVRSLFTPFPSLPRSKAMNAFINEVFGRWSAGGYPPLDTAFLLACLSRFDAESVQLLQRAGIDKDQLQRATESFLKHVGKPNEDWTDEAYTAVYQQSAVLAAEFGAKQLTPIHLLLALVRSPSDRVRPILAQANLSYERLRQAVLSSSPHNDATAHLVTLGNPAQIKYSAGDKVYARNVWDLQAFDGQLYVGYGNSSNVGPVPNAGPVDLWRWDPAAKEFQKDFTVDDEQIDRFRIIEGKLIIPGHDPKESWELGNFYVREQNGWRKIRTLPNGIHCYDMIGHEGKLFAALGTEKGACVAVSQDFGKTWSPLFIPEAGRAYSLFTLGGQLYTVTDSGLLFRYREGGFQRLNIDLFPKAIYSSAAVVARATNIGKSLVYIGGNNTNDHQWEPFSLFAASDVEQAHVIELPESRIPYDIVVDGKNCYVLTSTPREDVVPQASSQVSVPSEAGYTMVVYASGDLEAWQEVVRFTAPTFARSFEKLNNDLYFGLGCHTTDLSPACGQVLRIEKAYLRPPTE
jgi:hypothetical protein